MYRVRLTGGNHSYNVSYMFAAEIFWSYSFWRWKKEYTRPIYSRDGKVWYFVTNDGVREYFGHPVYVEATRIAALMAERDLDSWGSQLVANPTTF